MMEISIFLNGVLVESMKFDNRISDRAKEHIVDSIASSAKGILTK